MSALTAICTKLAELRVNMASDRTLARWAQDVADTAPLTARLSKETTVAGLTFYHGGAGDFETTLTRVSRGSTPLLSFTFCSEDGSRTKPVVARDDGWKMKVYQARKQVRRGQLQPQGSH